MRIKSLRHTPWLFILGLICACSGASHTVVETPTVLQDGMKAIEKGNRLYARGCYQQAAARYYRAHVEFTAADYLPGIATSLNSLGNVYQATGSLEDALAFFDEAITLSDAAGDRQAALLALSNKAAALIGADRLEAAEAFVAKAERRATKPFLPLQINKGILLIKKAAYTEAQAALEKALSMADRHDRTSLAKIHFAIGRLLSLQGDTAGAIEHFQQALENDQAIGFYQGMARDHTHLGDAYKAQAALKKALSHYKRAVKIFALVNARDEIKPVLEKLEQTAAATGTDIRLTAHFVKTWLEDKTLDRPCR